MKKQLFLLMLLSAGWSTIHSANVQSWSALQEKIINLTTQAMALPDESTEQKKIIDKIIALQKEQERLFPDLSEENYRNENGG